MAETSPDKTRRHTPPSRGLIAAGTLAVVAGAIGAAIGSWSGQLDLRTGVVPWASGVLVIGIALIVFGSYRVRVGRPPRLARWSSIVALLGLVPAAAFLFGTGILGLAGSDLLSQGDTAVSALGTLLASVCTLLLLPAGLLGFGVALLADEDLPRALRVLPLAATLAFVSGPVLIGVLPELSERNVFIAWPLALGAAWAAYGLLLGRELSGEVVPAETGLDCRS